MTPDRRLLFMGSKEAGLRICRNLVDALPAGTVAAILCPDDRADARNVFSAFEALAASSGIPLYIVGTKAETVALVRQYAPATALVHGWYTIIPLDELAETQFFGFHYSPLPRYRGNAPLVWQILNGEEEVGVSLFELVEEMDAGRLYAQETASLGADETIADALSKADALAEAMMASFVPAWLSAALHLHDQPAVEPSYCGLRTPEDGQIDWTGSGNGIHDFVRAQTRPYPGAFARLPDGRRLTVWKTRRETRSFLGVPGAVAEIAQDHVVVSAGTGAVRLIEVQVESEAPQPAKEVLRSLRLRLN